MKFNKTTTLFLVGSIIVIAGVSLGMTRSQQTEELQLTQKRLAQVKQRLSLITTDELTAQKHNLTLEIANYSAQTDSSRQKLLTTEDSITASNSLLEIAKSYGVAIIGISSKGESSGDLAGNKYTILPISIQVEGNIKSISDFVCNLSQKFPTSVVRDVQLTAKPPKPTPTPSPEPSPTPTPTPTPTPAPPEATPLPPGFKPVTAPEKNATASIDMIIYSYEDN